MKITVDSLYNDNNKLFTNNAFLLADTRLEYFNELLADLDLVCEHNFGTREFLDRYLKESNNTMVYDLTKIQRGVYACVVNNLLKYNTLIYTDEYVDTGTPIQQFQKTTYYGQTQRTDVHGQQQITEQYGQKQRTDVIANRSDTTTHGNISETDVTGASTDTATNGQRETTSSVTSFSSDTFNPTDKAVTGSVQDSTSYGSRTDTRNITQGQDTVVRGGGTDTYTDAQHTDTKGKSAYTDTSSNAQHSDNIGGFNDYYKSVNDYRKFADFNTLDIISNDVINALTYSLYL